MKLPLLSGRQVVAALQRLGFVEIHRKGSRVKMEHPDEDALSFRFTQRLIVTRTRGSSRRIGAGGTVFAGVEMSRSPFLVGNFYFLL